MHHTTFGHTDVLLTCCVLAVTLYFAVVANISISSLNLSLLLNSVGFYQVSHWSCKAAATWQAASRSASA